MAYRIGFGADIDATGNSEILNNPRGFISDLEGTIGGDLGDLIDVTIEEHQPGHFVVDGTLRTGLDDLKDAIVLDTSPVNNAIMLIGEILANFLDSTWHKPYDIHVYRLDTDAANKKLGGKIMNKKAYEHDFEQTLDGAVILDGEGTIDLNDPDKVFIGIIWDDSGFTPGAAISVQQGYGSEDEMLEIAFEILEKHEIKYHDLKRKNGDGYIEELMKEWGDRWNEILTEGWDGAAWTLPAQEAADIISKDKYAAKYIEIIPAEIVNNRIDDNYAPENTAQKLPPAYRFDLPEYAGEHDVFDLFKLLSEYHGGQGDPVYAMQSRESMHNISLEELEAVESLLDDIGSDSKALPEDISICESWLPEVQKIINSHKKNLNSGRKTAQQEDNYITEEVEKIILNKKDLYYKAIDIVDRNNSVKEIAWELEKLCDWVDVLMVTDDPGLIDDVDWHSIASFVMNMAEEEKG